MNRQSALLPALFGCSCYDFRFQGRCICGLEAPTSNMAAIMNKANKLRTALHSGNGLSLGAWQMLPGSHLSRTIARCGFDWVLVDCEHGNIAGKHQRL